jgi:hypothetical protein
LKWPQENGFRIDWGELNQLKQQIQTLHKSEFAS